jgi:large subunit ribosomal protein L20
MSRVKRGKTARRRRNKVLKEAKGYYGIRSKTFQKAKETLTRALAFAYRDRRVKKRMMRRIWVVRINAAARLSNLSYSQFMHGLNLAGIRLDRKVLADLAVHDPQGFEKIATVARDHLAAEPAGEAAGGGRAGGGDEAAGAHA